ncbi:MAG: transposase, partial [Acholeplasmataceae bacterium]
MENITSLRAVEKAARNDIRIMWLTNELQPTHQTIKDFMDRYLMKNLEDIYYDLNQFLIKDESIDVEKLYIDGTKIEANANKYTFIWKKSLEKFRDKLYKKITKQIKGLNDSYQMMDIFFPVYEVYETDYLKRILDFLTREFKKQGTQFVYGKVQRKAPLQRDYEK